MDDLKMQELIKKINMATSHLETISIVCMNGLESIKNLQSELEELKKEVAQDSIPIKTY